MSRARDGLGGGVQDRATPQWLVNLCQSRFGIDLLMDLAASKENKKCPTFISEEQNSLNPNFCWFEHFASHHDVSHGCWLNPPFDKVTPWMEKCADETMNHPGFKIITLTLASLGTKWYQDYVKAHAMSFILLDRIRFEGCPTPFNKECMISLWGFGMNGLAFWKQGKGNEE